ncbi:TolC family protein [Namhaeicola litoreus]|uniref:TolC family protein n=1 Tax=Namhaeicola litoreus TaxID=1052145 RepID=A0ABW3Y3R3_9FLAO
MKFNIDKYLFGFSILITFLSLHIGYGQNTEPISLDQAKALAIQNNYELRINQKSYAVAKAEQEQANAAFLPSLVLSNTSVSTNNPLQAFGFKLLQESVTTEDFNPDKLNDPGSQENFNTKIELIQPIFHLDGWKMKKAAKSKTEALELQNERSKEYLQLEIEKAYMQLQLAYEQQEVIEKALETGEVNLKISKDQFDQGLIQFADVINVEVRFNEVKNDLLKAKSNVLNSSEYLAYLIGKEPNDILIPTEKLTMSEYPEPDSVKMSSDRKDLLAIEQNITAQEQMLKSSQYQFVPKASAMAHYEWNDNDFMGFNVSNYLVGLQLSWDVFDGGKTLGKVHREKAMLEKNELYKQNYLAQSELELNKARRQMYDARDAVEIAELAVEQSKESYRIVSNRFSQGLEKTSDLLYAETQLQKQELNHSQALFNYNYALSYLNFLTK